MPHTGEIELDNCYIIASLGIGWLAIGILVYFPMLFYCAYKFPKIFDSDLFNEKYFHRNQALLPFYTFRRGGLYGLYAGFNWSARRHFPDYDFRSKLTRAQIVFCKAYVFVTFLIGLLLIVLWTFWQSYCK